MIESKKKKNKIQINNHNKECNCQSNINRRLVPNILCSILILYSYGVVYLFIHQSYQF